jgi:hypothetical protein
VVVDGPTNLTDQLPGSDGTVLDSVEYTWEPWDQPAYRERLKESYHVLRDQLP